MKTILSLLVLVLFTLTSNAHSKYAFDETALELAFEQSEDVSLMLSNSAMENEFASSSGAGESAKSQQTAAIIAFAVTIGGGAFISAISSFLIFPIVLYPLIFLPWHRFYLGTGGENFKIGGLYCITFSWCGWLSIIDGVMLFVDETESKYIDSPKYVMWTD